MKTQYIYDLELSPSFIPKPNDGEVEAFYLWSIEEVFQHLHNNEFKHNCGLVVIDFFVRHGISKLFWKKKKKEKKEKRRRSERRKKKYLFWNLLSIVLLKIEKSF